MRKIYVKYDKPMENDGNLFISSSSQFFSMRFWDVYNYILPFVSYMYGIHAYRVRSRRRS